MAELWGVWQCPGGDPGGDLVNLEQDISVTVTENLGRPMADVGYGKNGGLVRFIAQFKLINQNMCNKQM
jgi:hypothetical protein